MSRPKAGLPGWKRALRALKEFVQTDVALTRFAFCHASPETQRLLCAPAAFLAALLDRALSR